MPTPVPTEYAVTVGPSFINATDLAIEYICNKCNCDVDSAISIIFLGGVTEVIKELRK